MSAAARLLVVVFFALVWTACSGQAPAESTPPPATDPAPAAPPPDTTPAITAKFTCEDLPVTAVFVSTRVVLSLPDRTVGLPQVVAASGARYSDGTTTFWNKGREATFELDGKSRHCVEAAGGDTWTAAATQIGPVQIGMTTAEAETAIRRPFVNADAGECRYRRSEALPAGVMLMEVAGRIVRADITAAGVSTADGLGVGDTAAKVREIYGARVTATPHKYTEGQYLTLSPDAEHRVVFETDGQHVTRYRVGRVPEVEWVEGCS